MKVNSTEQFDVVVAGGGAAGIMAATAAARNGAKVLLVESQGCLGGSRTAVGVDTFYGFYTPGENPKKLVGGIPDEIVSVLKKKGVIFERQNTYGAGTGLTYDVEELKIAYEDLVLEAGVHLLYHTFVSTVEAEGNIVKSVVLANKAGLTRVYAKMFVDTTGDADIVARAGGACQKSEIGETSQSLTTIFFMGNVDSDGFSTLRHKELSKLMKEANDSGNYHLPRTDGSIHKTPNHGVYQANMVRVSNIDATDPYELSLAEVQGRKQVQQYVRFLKEKVPGFEDSFLLSTSQHIGVRETRKILGHYTLTEEDVVEGRKFNDSIACCGAPVEDHHAGADTRWVYVKGDGVYNIPYRCLLPATLENVIVAGRCLSATHGAQASARNSAQAMAMGQAAGTAVALSLKYDNKLKDIEINRLQDLLKSQGVIL